MSTHCISAENIVANYFDEYTNKDILPIKKISQIGEKLKDEFRQKGITVRIDNTRGAISNLLAISPEFFARDRENNAIQLTNRADLAWEVQHYFNPKLDREIREIYLQLIKTLVQEA